MTNETSLGFAAIEFAVEVCGIDLFPWQRWLLIHALELDQKLTVSTMSERGRLDPLFRFRKVIVLVARQNGKSTLSQVLSLFFLYVLGTDLVLGTAQDLDTAEEVWDGALDIIEETPDLAALADKPIRVNGKKTIRLKTGERYKVKAANRKAGRGLSGDLILLDELREHQSWDAWGAITKTTMARPAAMIWALSNAGDATSIVLRYLRKMAHAAVGDPDGINADGDPSALLPDESEIESLADLTDGPDLEPEDFDEDESTLGIFEWSAPPGCSVDDIDGILQANPSCGYCISLRTLLGDAKADPEWVFRTECLCQWSDGTLEGPFPPGTWDAGRFNADDVAPQIVGNVVACVDTSQDRIKTVIALAGRQASGRLQVEVVAERAGQDWVEGWLRDRAKIIDAVTGQTRGAPVSSLMDELRVSLHGEIEVVDWVGGDVPGWTGKLYDAVRNGELDHNPWPSFDLAAATAVPKMTESGAFMWDRKRSPTDIATLIAATGALGLLLRAIEQPAASAYESRGVITI